MATGVYVITTLAIAALLSMYSAEVEPVVLVPSLADIDQAEQRRNKYRVSLPERVAIGGRPYKITVTFGTRERFVVERDAGLENVTLADCDGVLRLGPGPAHEVLSQGAMVKSRVRGFRRRSCLPGLHRQT